MVEDLEIPEEADLTIWKTPDRFGIDDEDQFAFIFGSLGGIILAGALYPLVIVCFGFAIEFFQSGSLANVGASLMYGFPICVMGAGVGSVVFSFTGLIAIFLIWAVNKSFGNPFDRERATMSAGSLAGYIPTAWAFFGSGHEILAPIVAMIMGAYGASWCADLQHKTSSASYPNRIHNKEYRLSISHLMMGTAWIAGIFALDNLLGVPFFAIAIFGWLILHAILIGIVKIYKTIGPKASQSGGSDSPPRSSDA